LSSGEYTIGSGRIFASPKQGVFVLIAVEIISTAELATVGSLPNYVAFTLLVQITYLLIIGAYAIARTG
jgi:hypothetical protein